jgi:pilus assembly protein CpaB
MNLGRLAILIIAVGAAVGAVVLAMGDRTPKTVDVAPVAAVQPPMATEDVLVAAQDLSLGATTKAADFAWQPWPKDAVNPLMIKKSEDEKAFTELSDSIVRVSMIKGEPIRREKLIKSGSSGFLAAVLPSGMRAVAINIDSQGATTAGNFIHPGDQVDVIRTVKPDNGSQNAEFQSETLLRNIKVLAIGTNVEDKNGQQVVTGSTATLELDPAQSEAVIQAQRTGQLSLVLRSIRDWSPTTPEEAKAEQRSTTVVRYGVQTETTTR